MSRIVGRLELFSRVTYPAIRGIPCYRFRPLVQSPDHVTEYRMCYRHARKHTRNLWVVGLPYTSTSRHPDGSAIPRLVLDRVLGECGDLVAEHYGHLLRLNLKLNRGLYLPDSLPSSHEPDEGSHYEPDEGHYISIDPPGTRDIDDAFWCPNGQELRIAIANPWKELMSLGLEARLQYLVAPQSETLYGPMGHNYTMLPEELATDRCSLLPKTVRAALVLCLTHSDETGLQINWRHQWIQNQEAQTYESANLDAPQYRIWYNRLAKLIGRSELELELETEIGSVDSHLWVEALMIFFNHQLALRSTNLIWRACDHAGASAHYCLAPDRHVPLGLDHYTHGSSPIRRMCDLFLMAHHTEPELLGSAGGGEAESSLSVRSLLTSELVDQWNDYHRRAQILNRIARILEWSVRTEARTGELHAFKILEVLETEQQPQIVARHAEFGTLYFSWFQDVPIPTQNTEIELRVYGRPSQLSIRRKLLFELPDTDYQTTALTGDVDLDREE